MNRRSSHALMAIALLCAALVILPLSSCGMLTPAPDDGTGTTTAPGHDPGQGGDVQEPSQELWEIRNGNVPYFTAEDYEHEVGWEHYSPLDSLGREGYAMAMTAYSNMNFDERGDIGSFYPSGWEQANYDVVDGGWLYNRCHLFGRQLGGDDIRNNLMTGTQDFNVNGMLTFENMVADHMKDNRTHRVLYRATPDFGEGNLLAYGILIESDCLDCEGEQDNVCFCVYIRNQQAGVTLDYSDGESFVTGGVPDTGGLDTDVPLAEATYIVNTESKKFHTKDCGHAPDPDSPDYGTVSVSRAELEAEGYDGCGFCIG